MLTTFIKSDLRNLNNVDISENAKSFFFQVFSKSSKNSVLQKLHRKATDLRKKLSDVDMLVFQACKCSSKNTRKAFKYFD